MVKRGRKYEEALEQLDKTKLYSPEEAIDLAKKMSYAGFDETVELHLRMGLDPRNATQQVRGVTLLPHGLGKQVRVLVFAQGEGVKTAEAAGADYVGGDDLVKKIEEGWTEFDTAIATPDMMGKVGKLGKVLGRKGLMPNPKSGTVVPATDLTRAIEDARKGRLEFKLVSEHFHRCRDQAGSQTYPGIDRQLESAGIAGQGVNPDNHEHDSGFPAVFVRKYVEGDA
jgi:large subunit ribosomal protein L1